MPPRVSNSVQQRRNITSVWGSDLSSSPLDKLIACLIFLSVISECNWNSTQTYCESAADCYRFLIVWGEGYGKDTILLKLRPYPCHLVCSSWTFLWNREVYPSVSLNWCICLPSFKKEFNAENAHKIQWLPGQGEDVKFNLLEIFKTLALQNIRQQR